MVVSAVGQLKGVTLLQKEMNQQILSFQHRSVHNQIVHITVALKHVIFLILQMAEDTSSSHAQPLHGRRNRRRSPSATSGSKTDSSPENSLSSYITDHDFISAAASVTTSVEALTMMQKKMNTLEETVNECRAQITELNERIRHLELRNAQKDMDDSKTAIGQLITIPEHSESLDDQLKARLASSGTTNDASTISDEKMATTVVIPCEAQTSTKRTNSAPFFSDIDNSGYQMCINLSRSEELNPELTFALVLMRGKLDKHLPWPFNRKIVLTVISKDTSKHEVIAIQPKSEKSFQRPKSDLNEPFIFLKKHYTVLFDGGFISDDKVAIQVTVT